MRHPIRHAALPFRADKGAGFYFSFRPDAATSLKPLDQPPVLHGAIAKAVGRHSCLSQKLADICEKFLCHGSQDTRFCVHVNTRYNVQPLLRATV